MENNEKKNCCPILDVDGVISGGKQFDLDITLPEDNRDVIYGVVKNCFKEPVCDAVVKLVEVVCECGKEERRPLCPGRKYALQIWVNDTKKIKICAKCHHEGKCLKGEKHEKCDCFLEEKPRHDDECKDDKHDKDKCDKDYYGKDKCDKDYHEKDKCCKEKCDKDYYEKDKCEKNCR